MLFSRQAASWGLVNLKYAPYSLAVNIVGKLEGIQGIYCSKRLKNIRKTVFYWKFYRISSKQREMRKFSTVVKVNSLKLLIDNSGNSPYNDIKLNWYERLIIFYHIKLHLITLKVKIMRIIQIEHTHYFSTVLPLFRLLAVKTTPTILCGPRCAHRLDLTREPNLSPRLFPLPVTTKPRKHGLQPKLSLGV